VAREVLRSKRLMFRTQGQEVEEAHEIIPY